MQRLRDVNSLSNLIFINNNKVIYLKFNNLVKSGISLIVYRYYKQVNSVKSGRR